MSRDWYFEYLTQVTVSANTYMILSKVINNKCILKASRITFYEAMMTSVYLIFKVCKFVSCYTQLLQFTVVYLHTKQQHATSSETNVHNKTMCTAVLTERIYLPEFMN